MKISGIIFIALAFAWTESYVSALTTKDDFSVREKRYSDNYDEDNQGQAYIDSAKLKRVRKNHGKAILQSHKLDEDLASRMAGDKISGSRSKYSDRKRRDRIKEAHETGGKSHFDNVKADVISAAAESEAAEKDAFAAAVDIGGETEHGSKTYGEENVSETKKSSSSSYGNRRGSISEFDTSDITNSGSKSGSDFSSRKSTSNSFSHGANQGTEDEGGSDTEIDDVQSPIQKLIEESSYLAKEIRSLFEVLARRENYLVDEMHKLKTALEKAINVLQAN